MKVRGLGREGQEGLCSYQVSGSYYKDTLHWDPVTIFFLYVCVWGGGEVWESYYVFPLPFYRQCREFFYIISYMLTCSTISSSTFSSTEHRTRYLSEGKYIKSPAVTNTILVRSSSSFYNNEGDGASWYPCPWAIATCKLGGRANSTTHVFSKF